VKARPAHRTPLSRKAWEREGPTPRAWEGEGFRINHNDTTDTMKKRNPSLAPIGSAQIVLSRRRVRRVVVVNLSSALGDPPPE
jgi:hypothetical protein